MRSLFRRHFLVIFVIIIAIISVRYLLTVGFHQGHDALWHVQRITVMFQELQKGNFPVRWVSSLDSRYGMPLFNYVYPGPYYLSSLLMLVGFGNVGAFNIITSISYIIGGVGMYFIFSKKPLIGFFTAIIYLFTPYQFVNIFVRSAFGEIMVMGVAPWVFIAVKNLQKNKHLRWYHPLPLALALISHNFLGPILLFTVIGYLIIHNFSKKQFLSIAFSLGLASFFLAPMFFERSYLLSTTEQNFSFQYSDHFIYPKQLLYSKWDYWFSQSGVDSDGMTFQLGFANIIIIVISIFSIFVHRNKRTKLTKVAFHLLCYILIFIFLTLSISSSIWDNISMLQVMQFPWRFLAFTAIYSSLLGGIILMQLSTKSTKAYIIIGSVLSIIAVINTRNYHRSMNTLTQDEFQKLHYEYVDRTTTSRRSELIPKWAIQERLEPTNPAMLGKRIAQYSGGIQIVNLQEKEDEITFTATAENEGSSIIIYQNYFPSWKAQSNNQDIDLYPSELGEIIIELFRGEHNYHIWMSQTMLEKFSNYTSLLTILILGIIEWKRKR